MFQSGTEWNRNQIDGSSIRLLFSVLCGSLEFALPKNFYWNDFAWFIASLVQLGYHYGSGKSTFLLFVWQAQSKTKPETPFRPFDAQAPGQIAPWPPSPFSPLRATLSKPQNHCVLSGLEMGA